MRAALDCDPDNWAIQSVSAMGEHFDSYWRIITETPGRISFAAFDKASGRMAGTSSMFDIDRSTARWRLAAPGSGRNIAAPRLILKRSC
jgi:hypothetical protein